MYQNGKLEQKSVNVIMKVVLKIDFGLEVDIAFNKLLNMCTFSVHKRSYSQFQDTTTKQQFKKNKNNYGII